MRRILLTAALLAGLAGPALAQRQGEYAVAGQTPDGQRYTGSLQMIPSGQNTWLVNWRVAGGSGSRCSGTYAALAW